MDEDKLICRCEEVTLKEIKEAIKEGASSVDGVKRITRAGMGLCQGRTCRCLVEDILSKELKKPIDDIPTANIRPPVRTLKLKSLATKEEEQ